MSSCNLVEQISQKEFSVQDSGCEYWLKQVAQEDKKRLSFGRDPQLEATAAVLTEGPLRQALIKDLAYKARAEEYASRALSLLIPKSPTHIEMEFLTTQLMDEVMHSLAFRTHLLDINAASEGNLEDVIRSTTTEEEKLVFQPLNEFFNSTCIADDNYLGGVAILTIIVEGVLAPLAELSEIKWSRLDPACAHIHENAMIDEIRHLNVGADIIKTALQKDPKAIDLIASIIRDGLAMWQNLGLAEQMILRESLYQEGMLANAHLVGDQMLTDSIKLIDSTVEQRMELSMKWSQETQYSRMKDMGLESLLA